MEVNPPEPFSKVDLFERMLLIKIFRGEKIY